MQKFPHQESAVDEINENNHPNQPVEPSFKEEIQRSISAMKNRKTSGADTMLAEVLKADGDEMTKFFHLLFNKVWQEEDPPLEWSEKTVTPVYKNVSKIDPPNYWAILLFSILGKVLSHILLQRIKQQSEEFIEENQQGFLSDRGTINTIFIVQPIVEKAKVCKVDVRLNFIDFKSALDTIWRKAFWKKLSSIRISKKIIKILEKTVQKF